MLATKGLIHGDCRKRKLLYELYWRKHTNVVKYFTLKGRLSTQNVSTVNILQRTSCRYYELLQCN